LGPPGVGKTHLAISPAITAAEYGRRVYYGTLDDLIASLEEAQTAGWRSLHLGTLHRIRSCGSDFGCYFRPNVTSTDGAPRQVEDRCIIKCYRPAPRKSRVPISRQSAGSIPKRGCVVPKKDYRRLLKPDRLRPTSVPGRTLEQEILSDTGRIVSSSAFRRLQTKAQVFSLERNAAVRTRLTHSLEVATFGQFIADRAFGLLVKKGAIDATLRVPFVQTVQNACLLHDIGNPPFGHLGEFAIRDWFDSHRKSITKYWKKGGMSKAAIDAHLRSFIHFDGNPQGLRIVTRLMWLNDKWGLNLTATLLASTLKYLGTQPNRQRPFCKKIGFFETERNRVSKICRQLGVRLDTAGAISQRHPLVFLMEAADDIAYCLSDIEDAVEKGICSQREFFTEIHTILPLLKPDARLAAQIALNPTRRWSNGLHASNAPFTDFSRNVTRQLTEIAARAFVKNETAICKGGYDTALLDGDEKAQPILNGLKEFARRRIFVAREAVEIELGGFRIVQALLDGYERLLGLTPAAFRRLEAGTRKPLKQGELALESRLYTLLPNKHRLAYDSERKSHSDIEPALRTHLVVDYITGMTDGYALKVFHMLMGTSHPMLEG